MNALWAKLIVEECCRLGITVSHTSLLMRFTYFLNDLMDAVFLFKHVKYVQFFVNIGAVLYRSLYIVAVN